MGEVWRRPPPPIIRIAKSFVRLIPCWVAAGPLHFERRKAVESSFRGPPATFPKHRPFGQNFWQPHKRCTAPPQAFSPRLVEDVRRDLQPALTSYLPPASETP